MNALLLLACAASTDIERDRAAMQAATEAGAGATEACRAIRDDEIRGMCLLTAWEHTPDLAGCVAIDVPRWRGECHFQLAETAMTAGDRAGAIALCGSATPFEKDCARHLWKIGLKAGDDLQPLLEELRAAFPAIAASLDTNTPAMRRMVERDRIHAEAFMTPALCTAEHDTVDCREALKRLLQKRWFRADTEDAALHAVLCEAAARGEVPDPDDRRIAPALRWERGELLDGAVRDVQGRVCP